MPVSATLSERTFALRGIAASVAVPEPAVPEVRRSVRAVGDSTATAISARLMGNRLLWARLGVNAIGTFVCVVVGSLVFLALVPMVFGFRSVVVASGSMSPALRTSDVVVTDSPRDALPVGSVIDFYSTDGTRIHRIVEVTDSGYRTKGDANPTPDREIVEFSQVRGVGVMVVPFVGLAELWFSQGRWAPLAGLTVSLAVAALVTPRRWIGATYYSATTDWLDDEY